MFNNLQMNRFEKKNALKEKLIRKDMKIIIELSYLLAMWEFSKMPKSSFAAINHKIFTLQFLQKILRKTSIRLVFSFIEIGEILRHQAKKKAMSQMSNSALRSSALSPHIYGKKKLMVHWRLKKSIAFSLRQVQFLSAPCERFWLIRYNAVL